MTRRTRKALSTAALRRILEAAESKARRAFVAGDGPAYRAAIQLCRRTRAELRMRHDKPPLTD